MAGGAGSAHFASVLNFYAVAQQNTAEVVAS
jgi:hypothetical protein